MLDPIIILFYLIIAIVSVPGQIVLAILLPKQLVDRWDAGSSLGGWHYAGAFVSLLIAGVLGYVVINPNAEKYLYTAVLTVLTGTLAYIFKKSWETMNNRAQLLIVENLSRRKLNLSEIKECVSNHSWPYLIFSSVYSDALAELIRTGQVNVEDGLFSTTANTDSKE